MLVLMLFAAIAGAGRLSPCALPVLPRCSRRARPAAGAGHRHRDRAGASRSRSQSSALASWSTASASGRALCEPRVAVLFAFGLAFLMPPFGDRIEARAVAARAAAALGAGAPDSGRASRSGRARLVYAPCAGPILAAVISVSAAASTATVAVPSRTPRPPRRCCCSHSAAAGRRAAPQRRARAGPSARARRRHGRHRVAVATELDVRFQTALANHCPTFLINPTSAIERSSASSDRLADLRGSAAVRLPASGSQRRRRARRRCRARAGAGVHPHPALVQLAAQLSLAGLRGRVVLDRLLDLHLHQLHPDAARI